mmetsp:Transcript_1048/g.3497  ORF Transcript_1048/g.3497 Transcript_1048/m.3497 type:complete len:91 (-) Transcript_1048:783-1055(-)
MRISYAMLRTHGGMQLKMQLFSCVLGPTHQENGGVMTSTTWSEYRSQSHSITHNSHCMKLAAKAVGGAILDLAVIIGHLAHAKTRILTLN